MNEGMITIIDIPGYWLCARHYTKDGTCIMSNFFSVVLGDGYCYYSDFIDERLKVQRG